MHQRSRHQVMYPSCVALARHRRCRVQGTLQRSSRRIRGHLAMLASGYSRMLPHRPLSICVLPSFSIQLSLKNVGLFLSLCSLRLVIYFISHRWGGYHETVIGELACQANYSFQALALLAITSVGPLSPKERTPICPWLKVLSCTESMIWLFT